MNIVQSFSTSNKSCIIRFTGGGPYDGQTGLYDHDQYDAIIICSQEEKKIWTYKRQSLNHYALDNVLDWETDTVGVY
jgi:hypothetical protein